MNPKVQRKKLVTFLFVMVLVTCYSVLFLSPRIGAADNGDFYRLAERIGIKGDKSDQDYQFNIRIYEDWEWKPFEAASLTPQKQSFGNIWIASFIRLIINIISNTKEISFSTYYFAICYFFLLGIAAFLLLYFFSYYFYNALPWFTGLVIIVFCGSMHLGWFNSFYGEALSFVALFLLF